MSPAPTPARQPSLRERFHALRNLPPFLRQIWQTSPTLTIASLGLRLLRALMPVATLYIGKLIIDEAIRLAGTAPPLHSLGDALASGRLDHLLGLLALELGLAIGSDLLGRMVAYADNLLSELFNNVTSVRLMEHAAQLDLEDFEDPELQDRLDRARRQSMGRMNLMSQLFGQVQDAITVASFAVGLLVYAPWLMALLALALVPAFIGESHFNALGYSLNYQWTPERRQLDYLRQVGASVETAKEVKIFNLHRFLIERYRQLADRFFRANRALARKRAVWGTLLAALGTPGLLRGLWLHRLAHHPRRLQHWRPDLPGRQLPAPAAIAGRAADWLLLQVRRAGAAPGRPVLVLRDRAGNRLAPRRGTGAAADQSGLRVRERRLPLSRSRAVGGAAPGFPNCAPAKYWRWWARTAPARPPWSSCWRGSTTPMKAASCWTAATCATTTWTTCAPAWG